MKPSKKSTTFRTRLLIYPRFQLRLLAVNLAVMGATFLAVAFFVSRSYANLRAQGLAANLAADHAYFRFIEYQSSLVYTYLGGALAVGFLLSAVMTLVLSNKLAGPIVRLHEFFRQIIKGQRPVPAVFFRRSDFFKDLPPLINHAMDILQREGKKDDEKKEDGKKAA
ncbi:MAG: hypothetical protein HYW49_10605 [Deltaproteobacteria bacterium]|nr:hypothetical protein [Deltaproteobacteria bacterium]